MSRSTRSRSLLAAPLTVVLLTAAFARAEPATFEVSGSLDPHPQGLAVRVLLRNTGRQAAETMIVSGALLGRRAWTASEEKIAPGASREVVLRFAGPPPASGVHALVLRLEYTKMAREETSASRAMQWAYLLMGFGPNATPAVRLEVSATSVDQTATLPVILESADGQPHRVRLAVFTPNGVAVVPARAIVEVPAAGPVTTRLRIMRALAPDHSRPGLLVVAATEGEAIVKTAVATTVVEIRADPGVLPRRRRPLLGLALLLAGGSAYAQWRREAPAL